ncbi:ribonuclease HII [Parvibaculum sp.]|uniref:ribonuclease HII n=1 Tax=Parvibaculum sp. TaxID=2024848 RepID=UPI001D42A8C0|nr:ribonuclease HII [Parvibaculum sp.]MBX3490524.1 ribonuclease HII [Parvibaculum sp.]MCW5728381.1 ribonuclease HII [Parvibaculum sp.]
MPRAPSPLPDFRFELEAGHPRLAVCGVDEAGRGPWAGPVVAAAVILDAACIPPGLNDSKKLDAARRESLFAALEASAVIGIGEASVAEIDRLNILQATMLAMRRAVAALAVPPAFALIDGNRLPALPCPARAIVKGDALSLSVAAASIAAKTVRDRTMCELAEIHPGYGFERHKGYGTAAHAQALLRLGPSPAHRTSFAPIRKMLSPAA